MIAKKTCFACGKRLPAAEFNGSATTADGLARTCRACTNARRRERERSGAKHPRGHAPSTLLASALRHGDIKTVRKLVHAGMTPHWGWVCETMREGHLALAEVLLESRLERNTFTMAAMGDVKRLTRRLQRARTDARLTASMDPASSRVTPLHVGCASDWKSHGDGPLTAQVQVAMTLTEHGADLNALARYRGIDDVTPLFCACWTSRNLALVRWLLDHGAPTTDACLPAALGHLQRHGRGAYDIAEALLDWGLPVDGGVAAGRTPLQAFAHQADHRAVAWLIAHGADVNARSIGGRTAVHYAAERNTGPKTLALLVESGADLSARDEGGRTPLEIARRNGKTRLVEWIARRGRALNR
jgi:hypothetical protein